MNSRRGPWTFTVTSKRIHCSKNTVLEITIYKISLVNQICCKVFFYFTYLHFYFIILGFLNPSSCKCVMYEKPALLMPLPQCSCFCIHGTCIYRTLCLMSKCNKTCNVYRSEPGLSPLYDGLQLHLLSCKWHPIILYFVLICSFPMYTCVCLCACTCAIVYMWQSEESLYGSQFCPSMWVPGIPLRSPALVTSTLPAEPCDWLKFIILDV